MSIDDYNDIINLPHYVSKNHAPMSRYNRAAQFAPFAALTGYHESVKEAARLTERRKELDEKENFLLNAKMEILKDNIKNQPAIEITYFKPDKNKSGGEYVVFSGIVKGIREHEKVLVMQSGDIIPLMDIIDIDGEIFNILD